jgi:ubiquinone/menaquinone biosynthesis C-methylase UbiE
MRSTATRLPGDDYVLTRDATEYERLRAQARVWQAATNRLFDQVALGPGARCLDAGCGPGHTMRLMAERVGPSGHVTGVDIDAALGDEALALLLAEGFGNCAFEQVDLEADEQIPGAPFDLVYARLLLFHARDQAAMVRRLWEAVAPGGYLVLHDYDIRTADVMPSLQSMQEWKRVVLSALSDAGRDIHIGHRLPLLFQEAGIGTADGTDVAGRLETLRSGGWLFSEVYRSVLPLAFRLGLATRASYDQWSNAFARDTAAYPDSALMWPLLVGTWKRKPAVPGR